MTTVIEQIRTARKSILALMAQDISSDSEYGFLNSDITALNEDTGITDPQTIRDASSTRWIQHHQSIRTLLKTKLDNLVRFTSTPFSLFHLNQISLYLATLITHIPTAEFISDQFTLFTHEQIERYLTTIQNNQFNTMQLLHSLKKIYQLQPIMHLQGPNPNPPHLAEQTTKKYKLDTEVVTLGNFNRQDASNENRRITLVMKMPKGKLSSSRDNDIWYCKRLPTALAEEVNAVTGNYVEVLTNELYRLFNPAYPKTRFLQNTLTKDSFMVISKSIPGFTTPTEAEERDIILRSGRQIVKEYVMNQADIKLVNIALDTNRNVIFFDGDWRLAHLRNEAFKNKLTHHGLSKLPRPGNCENWFRYTQSRRVFDDIWPGVDYASNPQFAEDIHKGILDLYLLYSNFITILFNSYGTAHTHNQYLIDVVTRNTVNKLKSLKSAALGLNGFKKFMQTPAARETLDYVIDCVHQFETMDHAKLIHAIPDAPTKMTTIFEKLKNNCKLRELRKRALPSTEPINAIVLATEPTVAVVQPIPAIVIHPPINNLVVNSIFSQRRQSSSSTISNDNNEENHKRIKLDDAHQAKSQGSDQPTSFSYENNDAVRMK